MAATEAVMSVLAKATRVVVSQCSSLPALKPYQPNQRRAVPRATRGTLWGPLSMNLRLPTKTTEARAANPAVVWTAVPPAKSSTPHLANRPLPQTMCAAGK